MSTGQSDTQTSGGWEKSGSDRSLHGGDISEQHNLRRLQAMMQLLLASIEQDRTITIDEAAQMVANARHSVLRMFPGKEDTYNLLCRPRIQRAMRERFRIQ